MGRRQYLRSLLNIHRYPRFPKWLWIILIPYILTQVYCINKLSLTSDEPIFASYGMTLLKLEGKKDVIYHESKLPMVALNMVPRAVEQVIDPGLQKEWPEATEDIVRGRYVTLLFTIALGLLIFHWGRRLYGETTAFLCFALYLLCPNFLAHGIFVSTDIYACFFLTLSIYSLWYFLEHKSQKHFLIMSFAVAFAQISKFSMLHLFLIIPLIILLHHFLKHQADRKRIAAGKSLVRILIFLLINWLVISASHLFYGIFNPLAGYQFLSPEFKSMQQAVTNIFPSFPVPLPSSYIGSVDAVLYFDKLGGGVPGAILGPIYILGNSSAHGFWYYYLVALFYKLPIPVIMLWIGCIGLAFLKFRDKEFTRRTIFFLIPVFYYLIYLSFFYGTQIGIRHIMIIFPLLYIFAGEILTRLLAKKPIVVIAAFLWTLISVMSYYPHFLPYTNEFILDKKTAYRKISESNLSYGEGRPYLDAYLKRNKDAVVHPEKPSAGKIIMEVGNITNSSIHTMNKYDWVRDLKPVGHIHSQYIIFDVDQQAADSLIKLRTQ